TWLSILRHLVGLISGSEASPVYQFLSDLLLLVARQRAKPEVLPGLEAMTPASPLVKVLNRPNLEVSSDLSVIAGDIEDRSALGRLKLLMPDLFYGGDHDLVVDTSSMFGGARRSKDAARFFFDQGPEVCHFHYFRNSKTATRLLAGLTQAGDGRQDFQPLDLTPREPSPPAPPREGHPRPVVIIVPGIMGTHLKVNGDRIWMDPFDLAVGGMRKLGIDAPNVAPDALMGSVYGDIMRYLARTHEVIAFPYDWRKSIRDEAKRLAALVADTLEQEHRTRQPVQILAHSMGGLVTRAMFALFPDLWARLTQHPDGRFVMLGTPNGGSYTIPRLLVAQEKTVRLLALVDFTQTQSQLLQIISGFPGVLEMLPPDPQHDLFAPAFWTNLLAQVGPQAGWVAPPPQALEAARATRAWLDQNPPQSDRILYVAGCAPETPVALEVVTRAGERTEVRFHGSAAGDGRVPWSTGVPRNVRTWFMRDVAHGDLAAHEPAFPALLELLLTGTTARLAATAPVVERGVESTFVMEPDRVDLYPDNEGLALAVTGSRPRRRSRAKRAKTRVTIAHGDLAYARYPILVGHYIGDGLVSAEAYLDRALGGRLRTRQSLDLYPGPLQTAEVLLGSEGQRHPAGAVVMGLGWAGKLTPNALLATTAQAVRRYALALAERQAEQGSANTGVPVSVRLSALLVGSGAGALTVQDSVLSLLRGVRRAIRILEERKLLARMTIDEVEFVEVFEDRAIEAARALDGVARDRDLDEDFTCETKLRRLDGGRRRAAFEEPAGWWHRLQITSQNDGSLKFVAMTQRARAEQSLVPIQRALVDTFIVEAMRDTSARYQVARTLFEQLLPNDLKEQATNREDVVLVLDEGAAAYPWELLEDRISPDREPLSVQAGVIRQLETREFRPHVVPTTRKGALVIGDPDATGEVALPGAEAEAHMVVDSLRRNGYEVTECIRNRAPAIAEALHAESYRILHLAGHGVHQYPLRAGIESCALCKQPVPGGPQLVSGMIIGKGIVLTPADVDQMRRVPDLVFINCCHLGRVDPTPEARAADLPAWNQLAANLAAQFIRMGVKVVVAAGWAVDDQAAGTFARRFYDELMAGVPFGRAVLEARREAYRRHPGVNTWGAYQCYGDPEFRLATENDGAAAEPAQEKFHAATEVCVRLEELAAMAANAAADDFTRLTQRLDTLAEVALRDWADSAEVLAALAAASAELGRFEQAVQCIQRALVCEGAHLDLQSVEQMYEHQTRWAVQCARQSKRRGDSKASPYQLIEEAIEGIERLLCFGETSNRLSLLANAHKRLACISTGQRRKAALSKMRGCFARAVRNTGAEGRLPKSKDEFNLAVAKLLCATGANNPREGRSG
ncbi:MAG TPA: CHAT domain-containing protein, partial [Verrucomicrobiota bacterium]|nr:CHAT domain-containing protein [Verrucomicrobiota bacterium]